MRLAVSPLARYCWVFGYFIAFCASASAAAPVSADQLVIPAANSNRNSGIEERKLDLERAKFEFEKEKHKSETDQKRQDSRNELIKAIVAAVSLGVPFLVAIIGLWAEGRNRRHDEIAQRQSREKNEELQFQLKAAEIALDVRISAEIRPKAEALAQLFPGRLPQDFARNLDPEMIHFGLPNAEAKMELLKLLSQYPGERDVTLRIWGHMFPADTGKWRRSEHPDYSWFKAILEDATIVQRTA